MIIYVLVHLVTIFHDSYPWRPTNSNSIVMDLLLVGDTYGCDGDSSQSHDRRRSQIILSQKQYKDRLSESYRSNSIHCENMPSIEEGAVLVQTHPVYEVICKLVYNNLSVCSIDFTKKWE